MEKSVNSEIKNNIIKTNSKFKIMKTRLLFLMLFFGLLASSQAQVSISSDGTDPHESAMLDVNSTDKGLLIPRMSSAERATIVNPANGLMVFDLSSNTFWFYSDATSQWEEMGGAIVNVLNDLLDAKTDANSIYIGDQTATNDDGDNFNVAIGQKSMKENLSGNHNTALGYAAMKDKTTGNNNIAVGNSALEKNLDGNNNSALGANALYYNLHGQNNVAVGHSTLYQNIGFNNTAIGSGAGNNSYSTSGNIFIGYEAGKNEGQSNKLYIENSSSYTPLIGGDFNTDEVIINGELEVTEGLIIQNDVDAQSNITIGQNLEVNNIISTNALKVTGGTIAEGKILTSDANGNATWQVAASGVEELDDLNDAKTDANSVFIGIEAGLNDDGDNYNVAVGNISLKENTTGENNAALGYGSLGYNTMGENNVAIGSISQASNTTGNENTSIGYSSLALNSNGSGNVAVGNQTLLMNIGEQNTALGKGAGQNSNNTSGNVFIGYEAGKDENGSNKLYIENSDSPTPLIGGDFDTDEVEINGSLSVNGNATAWNLETALDITVGGNLIINDSILANNIKITTGTPAEGKILTSDAEGNASWQDAANTGAEELNDLIDAKTKYTSIFVGENSGQNVISNSQNTAMGFHSFTNNTTGGANNVFGKEAMESNINGNFNTAMGLRSLYSNTSGDNNTAIGNYSLYNNLEGNNNTAIGYNAGKGAVETSISGSVFIGNSAGYSETEDNKLYIENTNSTTPLIGGDFDADYVDINGDLNITGNLKIEGGIPEQGKILTSDADGNASWQTPATGSNSIDDLEDAKNDNSSIFLGTIGASDVGGSKNTAVGIMALNSNQIGEFNAAFGHSSLKSNTSGIHNTAYGYGSMELSTGGIKNTAIGSGALLNNGMGSHNTAIGFEAGFGSYGSDASENIFIGYQAGYYETESNKLYIENSDAYYPLVYGDFDQDLLQVNGEFRVNYDNVIINNTKLETNVDIDANANVDIAGTLSVDGDFTANSSITSNGDINTSGNITAGGNIVNSGNISTFGDINAVGKITASGEITANDKIMAHDDIVLSDNKNITYENVRTGKLQIGGSEFNGDFYDYDSNDPYYPANQSDINLLTGYINVKSYNEDFSFGIYAPVRLPENATITKMTAYMGASTQTDIDIRITKREPADLIGDGDYLFNINYIFVDNQLSTVSTTEIIDPLIDNDFVYVLSVSGDINIPDASPCGSFSLLTVTIEYEYQSLNY